MYARLRHHVSASIGLYTVYLFSGISAAHIDVACISIIVRTARCSLECSLSTVFLFKAAIAIAIAIADVESLYTS